MGDCSIWLFFPSLSPFLPPFLLPPCSHKTHKKTLLKISTLHIKGWMEKKEGGEEEEPSMHNQTSVPHWSASLTFADLLLWPKRKMRKSGG